MARGTLTVVLVALVVANTVDLAWRARRELDPALPAPGGRMPPPGLAEGAPQVADPAVPERVRALAGTLAREGAAAWPVMPRPATWTDALPFVAAPVRRPALLVAATDAAARAGVLVYSPASGWVLLTHDAVARELATAVFHDVR